MQYHVARAIDHRYPNGERVEHLSQLRLGFFELADVDHRTDRAPSPALGIALDDAARRYPSPRVVFAAEAVLVGPSRSVAADCVRGGLLHAPAVVRMDPLAPPPELARYFVAPVPEDRLQVFIPAQRVVFEIPFPDRLEGDTRKPVPRFAEIGGRFEERF